jgi:uncharacterized protein DUF6438
MRLLAASVALIAALAACGGLRSAPAENTGLGAITAVTMNKTACYGTCPEYTVRFLADGRARYVGHDYAPLRGRFSGIIDFAPIAAWIATQHPETLPDDSHTVNTDAPGVNLEIDYGARRIRFTGVSEGAASLRLEGILLALDGAAARVRWRREDPATAFLGIFRGGVTLTIGENGPNGGFSAYATPNGCPGFRYEAAVQRGALRLRCDTRTSVLRLAGEDLQADGDAIPSGRYSRISPYAAYPDLRMDVHRRRAE